jgi:hypothetical protein
MERKKYEINRRKNEKAPNEKLKQLFDNNINAIA